MPGSEVGMLEKSNCDASILVIRGFHSLSLKISNLSSTVLKKKVPTPPDESVLSTGVANELCREVL